MALTQKELNQALNINRMLEQWPATLDQNVRRAIREQEKLLAAALQRLASVLPAVGSKIPNQWVRVDKPPPIPTIDLAPLLSFAERIQKGLPQINYKGISSINLSTLTHPPRNGIVTFSPYTCLACGSNSQYTDNEEEPSDGVTDSKSGVEHSRRWHNYLKLLAQDWITFEANLTVGITVRVSIPGLLVGWAQQWEPVVWIVTEWLSQL